MTNKVQIVNSYYPMVDGLSLTWASNTTLTLASGTCRDSTNKFDITVPSALTLNAAITGVNGIDTGSFAASKCYAIFVIDDTGKTNTPKVLMSLSSTAPVLPGGYDVFRRIGWAFSDGSTHFILAYQSGSGISRQYFFDEPISAISAGTSATFLAVDLSQKVPAVDKLPIKLQLDLTPNAANDAGYVRTGGSSATNGAVMYGSVAAKKSSQELDVVAKLVTSAPTIEYKVTASGSLNALILGFIDYL